LQCSCFGAATKPVENASYEYSKDLYMYRAFNGYRYSAGDSSYEGEATRVYKGDTIRFDLDFDEGDGIINYAINDVPKGVAFKGMRGKELW